MDNDDERVTSQALALRMSEQEVVKGLGGRLSVTCQSDSHGEQLLQQHLRTITDAIRKLSHDIQVRHTVTLCRYVVQVRQGTASSLHDVGLSHNSFGYMILMHLACRVARWLSGRASDLRSNSRGFEARPRRCCVTTLGKMFTPYCLCHQAV